MWQSRRSVVCVLAFTALALHSVPVTGDDKPGPRFEVAPKVWFVGDRELDIRLVNLAPNQKVTVVGHTGRSVSRISRVESVADDKGILNLRGSDKPGPKSGAPFRVLWDTKEDRSVEPMKDLEVFRLSAEIDGKPVASGSIKIDYGTVQEPKVTIVPVKERGLRGEFFLPPGKGPFPGVIVLSGSEGGIRSSRFKAVVLAKHGFASLALAYFDKDEPPAYPDLPRQLIEIPLEYFETALAWMKEHKQVRGDRLAVMGGSRGGELALLLGSMFPEVKAVVAYTPSHLAWGGWPISAEDHKMKKNRPAWTYKGKPVPFMPRTLSPEEEKKLQAKDPLDRRPLFAEFLKDKPAVAAAAIPVEKIAGPILMITGKDDKLWPASEMADEVMKRLKAKNHRFDSEHLSYEGCGHSIGLPLGQPGITPGLGGTPEANSYAAWDSWPKVVRFLQRSLEVDDDSPKKDELQVGLNHLYLVVDEETFKSLAASEFLKNEFAGSEQRTTTAGDGRSWTGIYLYGTKTYLEFLPPGKNRPVGRFGIALGADQPGSILRVLDRLAVIPDARSAVRLTTRDRKGEKIPWFYTASLGGDREDLLYAYVMEYHPDYLRKWYPDIRPEEAGVSRSKNLARLLKADRLFKDVAGVTIALPEKEGERFLQLLKALGYQIEKSGDQHTARGPEIEFIVMPESSEAKGVIEVRLQLSQSIKGDQKHRFGPRSILEMRKDKTARWRF